MIDNGLENTIADVLQQGTRHDASNTRSIETIVTDRAVTSAACAAISEALLDPMVVVEFVRLTADGMAKSWLQVAAGLALFGRSSERRAWTFSAEQTSLLVASALDIRPPNGRPAAPFSVSFDELKMGEVPPALGTLGEVRSATWSVAGQDKGRLTLLRTGGSSRELFVLRPTEADGVADAIPSDPLEVWTALSPIQFAVDFANLLDVQAIELR